jgi:probable HAF family extracellular repeat protein
LGKLPGDAYSFAYAVSDDGSTVVGASYKYPPAAGGATRAFRWTAAGGISEIGDLPGGNVASTALGVSGDGSVVAGQSSSALSFSNLPPYEEPFRWSAADGMTGLGYLPATNGRYGGATAVSGDGQVIVGTSTGDNGARPFRWTADTGMVDLGDLDSGRGNQDSAFDVNSDGSIIVGISQLGAHRTAFRWSAASGMQSLGTLPGAGEAGREKYSSAHGVSDDGSVVVGSAYSADGGVSAFRWTETTGMVALGKLPGTTIASSHAASLSATAAVIVGYAAGADRRTRATLWNPSGEAYVIQELLVDQGLDVALAGGFMTGATAVSADGQTIVGWGVGPGGAQGWIATIPVPEPTAAALGFALFSALATAVVGPRSRVAKGGRRLPGGPSPHAGITQIFGSASTHCF